MRRVGLLLVGFVVIAGAAAAATITFGTGTNQFAMDFVDVGNPGNAPSQINYGRVTYNYRIGTYEVSRDQVTKASAAGGLNVTLEDMTNHGGNGGNRPATGIRWSEAARFVNWLNTSQGFHVAYQFATQPGEVGYDPSEIRTLWSSDDAWQLGKQNEFRHKDAHYFLPSDDEWYKAAFYDPNTVAPDRGGHTYLTFPTGSNTAPTPVAGGTAQNTAVFGQSMAAGPADVTNAGGLSIYGTMGQGGNVQELGEGEFIQDPREQRVLWGSHYFATHPSYLDYYSRNLDLGRPEDFYTGFRVAAVPEPSASWMVLMGAFTLMMRRRRCGPRRDNAAPPLQSSSLTGSLAVQRYR